MDSVSLFHGLFNAKAIIVEEQLWYYLTYSIRNKLVKPHFKGFLIRKLI